MDKHIQEIIDKALGGELLNKEEIGRLFSVEDHSQESFLIQQAGRKISYELLEGKGEIHGQIGIDVGQCPRECKFCSFAASNKVFKERQVLETEEVVEGVLSMEVAGANAIYIMSTASTPFNKYIEISQAVKEAMKTDVPLIANIDDFDLEKAKKLKEVGFTAVYHAIRMGEGEFTNISIERRKESIKAAKEAGLKVGMCVEPIGPEHTIEELVEKTLITRDLDAAFSGAMRRTQIESSILAKHGQVNYATMAKNVAVVALATGRQIKGNCTHEPNPLGVNAGANLLWAEVGSNPRDTERSTVRGWTVDRCRELYEECGWEVLEGPSKMF